MVERYYEKVYAGFLGMNIGIRLGAPIEPDVWTEERIFQTYGDLNGYVKDYINFAADDDVNGPVYFLRALDDRKETGTPVTPEDVAKAWLNYTRYLKGMFWWGGYGISTEHTAYMNLKMGIPAPLSGSAACNGCTVAEQIGGQIFIDTWGLIHPGDGKKAADDGAAAASVSHDGEGLNGARFICACIAQAFTAQSIDEIVEAGLNQIPEESLYYQVVKSVERFYRSNPGDFRGCFHMLEQDWGYDKYPGACHIIPNAGVCALALFYGNGDFSRTVEIACMCGWDTDCNAGNVGTIAGVYCGLSQIPDKYRRPINDSVVLSGISGYLNILDIPTYAKEIAAHGYAAMGEELEDELRINPEEINFDFLLPGMTHNMRVSNPFYGTINPSGSESFSDGNGLCILIDDMGYDSCRIYYKSFYGREDFSDERYSPVFSPKVYSGQKVILELSVQWLKGQKLDLVPYIKMFGKHDIVEISFVDYPEYEWFQVEFTIPDTKGDLVEEVGFIVRGSSFPEGTTTGYIHMNKFQVTGLADYEIDIAKQKEEFGTVTPFSTDGGNWTKQGEFLHFHRAEPAFAYTGNYYSKDYRVSALVKPLFGENHLMTVRAKGAMLGYGAGFSGQNRLAIYKNEYGYYILAETDYPWNMESTYLFEIEVRGQKIILSVNGVVILEAEDSSFQSGMYGFGSLSYGRTCFSDIKFTGLEG